MDGRSREPSGSKLEETCEEGDVQIAYSSTRKARLLQSIEVTLVKQM